MDGRIEVGWVVDGQMDGQVDRWMGGQVGGGWVHGWKDGAWRTGGGWVARWVGGEMDGRKERRMEDETSVKAASYTTEDELEQGMGLLTEGPAF